MNDPKAVNLTPTANVSTAMPSSVIRSWAYDAAARRLEILFRTGRRYSYRDVPEDVAEAMRHAVSKGEYFNAHIREAYRYTRER